MHLITPLFTDELTRVRFDKRDPASGAKERERIVCWESANCVSCIPCMRDHYVLVLQGKSLTQTESSSYPPTREEEQDNRGTSGTLPSEIERPSWIYNHKTYRFSSIYVDFLMIVFQKKFL